MANREKHMRDLVRDWIAGQENTIPTRARSSRIIGNYTKNRRSSFRRRPPIILSEPELSGSAPRLTAATTPPRTSLPVIETRIDSRIGRQRAHEPRRELRRRPRRRRCGHCF